MDEGGRVEVVAGVCLITSLTAAAGLQLRRRRSVAAHLCGVLAVMAPFVLVPSTNPMRTVLVAWGLAYLYSIHGLDRVLRMHRPEYEAWQQSTKHTTTTACNGVQAASQRQLSRKAARYQPLLESDLLIAQHLVGFVDLTVRKRLKSLSREERRAYVQQRLWASVHILPWAIITWYLLPSMASNYTHAACCSPLGQTVMALPFAHDSICQTHAPCHHLDRNTSSNTVPPLSATASAIVEAADGLLAASPALQAALPSCMATGLSLLMVVEVVAAIEWFVTTFKVFEIGNTIAHAAFGYTAHALLGDLFAASTVADFWGRRWNRAVQPILKNAFFLAVYTEGKPVTLVPAVLLTFFMSGVVHAAPMALSAPLKHSAIMHLFFLVHGVFVLVEAPLAHIAATRARRRQQAGTSATTTTTTTNNNNNNSSTRSCIGTRTWLSTLIFVQGVLFVVVTTAVLFHFTLLGIAHAIYDP
ncbi:hypothetical protein PTSG_07604 [Salpingoeca rosetta]|uniref:Wax synthase domain-containing protein n=1 Tax=Salpingoeca rosetta (strain ATCC 50818 / BSB-021) TaxID=946362 RepID=F2UH89_SALR5|nr:uncharacterized protein PTSG_07604 [Salpingoeca rosetta]EGD76488.1 hypothetical protein PTSG_07604 [Salpingoeca rosetta]|eukprot:XP_004991402.1 hypothetical protein PTSG_07604 [Salpingoeca rosetta]